MCVRILYLYLGGDKMRIVRYRVNTAMDTKYTIALISDLHGMFHAEILQSLKSENPDIMII